MHTIAKTQVDGKWMFEILFVYPKQGHYPDRTVGVVSKVGDAAALASYLNGSGNLEYVSAEGMKEFTDSWVE